MKAPGPGPGLAQGLALELELELEPPPPLPPPPLLHLHLQLRLRFLPQTPKHPHLHPATAAFHLVFPQPTKCPFRSCLGAAVAPAHPHPRHLQTHRLLLAGLRSAAVEVSTLRLRLEATRHPTPRSRCHRSIT